MPRRSAGTGAALLPLVALGFLTRVPLRRLHAGSDALRRSVGAFPAVAAVVAGAGIGVRAGAGMLWSPAVATVAAVAAMLLMTGALHEDGLADTADGFGIADRERRLMVMRDPRLGTFGTAALVGLLALRTGLLAPLGVADFARALLVAQVAGQGGMLLALHRWPAVPGSSAQPLAGAPGPVGAVVAGATVAAVAVLVGGGRGVVAVTAALIAAAAAAVSCRRALGGLNGDALGAVNQVAHVVALACMTASVA